MRPSETFRFDGMLDGREQAAVGVRTDFTILCFSMSWMSSKNQQLKMKHRQMDTRKRRRNRKSRGSDGSVQPGKDIDLKSGGENEVIAPEEKNRSAEAVCSDSEEEWLPDEESLGKVMTIWRMWP